MIDIVFPSGNENALAQMAKRLGISKLIFVYQKKNQFFTGKLDVEYDNALATSANAIKPGITICQGSREAIERGATYAYGFEEEFRKDHTHYRKSGLNHIMCKLAAEKNVAITFPFSTILSLRGAKRSIHLGRIMQNIRLCQKYHTPMKIASFAHEPYQLRAPHELAAFFVQLGMHPRDATQALS